MSLRALIHERADVRQGFQARLLRPQIRLEPGVRLAPRTGNFQAVAGAFDYLLRFLLQRLNPQARVAPWAAERGAELVGAGSGAAAKSDVPTVSRHPKGLKAAAFLTDAKRRHRAYLQNGQVTDELLMAAHRLAHLDTACRSGPERVDWNALNYLDSEDAADLKALLAAVDEKAFRAARMCIVDPVLAAADLVGGAEPGFILDDCLFRVLSGKDARVDLRDFHELVGCYLLLGIGGVRHADGKVEQCPVTSIGIYFSRFAYLWKARVTDLVPPGTLPDLARWFAGAACASNREGAEMLRRFRGPLALDLFARDGSLVPPRSV